MLLETHYEFRKAIGNNGMNQLLIEKDYKNIFHFFSEISAVPRGSKNNTAISNYLADFAKKRGLRYIQDDHENVIIFKEATKGYENAPAIIIQGHMDMVCEKTADSTHDFLTQGIELLVDGDYIYADRTTLGGDDGIALAYALAVLDDANLEHPRIEAVFTIDEETGMEGAVSLDVSELNGKYLLNIDSEEEGSLLTGAAGGLKATCELPVKRVNGNGLQLRLTISDLQGGHSGMDINKNKINATVLMGRLLFELKEFADYGLINMQGGTKDNAIPRDTYVDIFLLPEELENFKQGVETLAAKYKKELLSSEPYLNIQLSNVDKGEYDYLHPTSFEKMLFLLVNMPNGVQKMSADIQGLVESSLNLGIFHLDQDKAVFSYSIRSSVTSYKKFMGDRLSYMSQFLGGDFFISAEYPAWEYKKESKLRDYLCKIFLDQYGHEPKLEAIHAGLECGFFADKIPGIDIVSFGPNILDIHTPKERLSITSAVRVYKYLEKIIEGINE